MTTVTLDCEGCGPFKTVESDDPDELERLLADASVGHHTKHAQECPVCSTEGEPTEHAEGDHPAAITYRREATIERLGPEPSIEDLRRMAGDRAAFFKARIEHQRQLIALEEERRATDA